MIKPEAEKIIKNHVILSTGIAAIPLSYFNLHLVKRIQLDMVKQLCTVYAKSYYDVSCKAYIGALASTGLARKVASNTRGLSTFGKIMGTFSNAGFSAASTYAVGRVTARFFHDNIELSDINMDMAKDYFLEELEEGKSFANRIFKNNKQTSSVKKYKPLTKEEAFNELIELKELRDQEAISEETYECYRKIYLSKMDINL